MIPDLVVVAVAAPIVLSWAEVSNASGYKVYIARTADSGALPTGSGAAGCSTCVVSYVVNTNTALIGADQLREGESYTWVVAATSEDLVGTWSARTTFTLAALSPTLLPAPTPAAPDNASVIADDQPVFAWDTVASATSYRLVVARSASALPSDPTIAACPSCVINTIADREGRFMPSAGVLQPGETYFWRVKARSPAQYGNLSPVYTFTVPQLSASACTFSFLTSQLTVPAPWGHLQRYA